MQALASDLDARLVAPGLTHHHRIAFQGELGLCVVADHAPRAGGGERALGVQAAHAGIVGLISADVGPVAHLAPGDFSAQTAIGLKHLDRKTGHEIVGLAPLGAGGFGFRHAGRDTQQPIRAQSQHRHQQDRQIHGQRIQGTAPALAPERVASRWFWQWGQWQRRIHWAARSSKAA